MSRLAMMGVRSGAGMLLQREDGGATQALEVLGTMRGLAMKVGQMASYVDGIVPEQHREAYSDKLRALQAQAAVSAPAEIHARIEHELGAPMAQLFAEWDETPIASASIGQVHRARLHDGHEVAVKVQHIGVDQALHSDLDNAGLLEGLVGAIGGKRLNSKAMLEVVRARFREELDYALEAERLQMFAALHVGDPTVRVPRLYPALCTKRVLTTEFVRGLSFAEACRESDAERRAWAETLWRFVFKSTLVGGLLAADPHPGNYIFQADGCVTFLDYGCIQPVADDARLAALEVHRASILGDERGFAQGVRDMVGVKPGSLEPAAQAYVRECFLPLSQAPYRITRQYAAGLLDRMKAMAKLSLNVPEHEWFTMPSDMLFVNRLQFGFYSVLARLDVEVDYAAVESAFLKQAGLL